MATAVTAVTTAPQLVPTTATAPAASATATDPFDQILGTAVAAATPPGDDVSLAVGDVEADLLADPRTTDLNALALAATGVLIVVPGITPAAPQALPTVDLTAQAAVGVAADTDTALPVRPDATLSRAEQLRFQIAAGLQNQTPLTQQPDTRALPTTPRPEAATRAAVPDLPVLPAVGPNPTVATPANPLPAGVPAARTPTIPAQAPVVTDAVVVPAPPAPLTPPDVTVEAANSVAGLPDVTVGDRPSVAGERFVALANTGARLAETAPTAAPAVPFADVARDAGLPTAASQPMLSAPQAAPTQPAAVTTQPALPSTPPVTVVAEPVAPPAAAPQTITAPVTAFPGALAPNRPEMSTDVFVGPTAGVVTETATGRATRLARPPVAELSRDADTISPLVAAPVTAPTAPQTTDAPPAVARAAPAAPVAAQLTDGVVAHTRHLAATGEVEFRMRLDPPDLGQVRVNLVGSGEHVRGEVVVADDAVRRMIESQLPELRQRLEAAGVTVQRFDVTTDANAGGAGANPNGGSADRTPAADPPAAPAAARAARPWYAAPLPASGLDVTV